MPFGPVQMLVVGFEEPNFTGKIAAELQRLREQDLIRLIDLLVVNKDDDGNITAIQTSDLSQDEAMEFGAIAGALIGFGVEGEEGIEAGAIAGAEALADGHAIGDDEVWYVEDAIPERFCRGGRADRAPLGHPAQGLDRRGRRDRARRRVDPPEGPHRGRAGGRGGDVIEKGASMAIGPVQLIVLGFKHPDFRGEIIDELEKLRESDTVRVIDALAVYKDAEGEIEVAHLSNLTADEAVEFGRKVGALIGLGIEGEEGMEEGAIAGAEAAADGINVFSEEEAWDVLEDIPNDSAAALILIEHHWAVPLRNAIARAGGFRISDAFISPLDLIAIGLVTAEEAQELHELETAAAEAAK